MEYFDTIINLQQAAALIENDNPVVVDCRFYLEDVDRGRTAYEAGHIPTAQYAHVNEDLSDLSIPDAGRHPLLSEGDMVNLFGRLGITTGRQVIVYDDTNGAGAARLWWMLRYMSHDRVAVLDGGFPAWKEAGLPLVAGIERREAAIFVGRPRQEMLVEMEDITGVTLLVDSRAPERFRGEIEPIDPVAGHIPGAINRFHKLNFDENGRILPDAVLRRHFEEILGQVPASEATFYCGSGVTACNNLLALAHAGLGDGRLYAGSWSQWCSDPQNPIVVEQ
ncbi:MAG: sulfurtransferase [Candidatus Promineifilaceae bacterium]